MKQVIVAIVLLLCVALYFTEAKQIITDAVQANAPAAASATNASTQSENPVLIMMCNKYCKGNYACILNCAAGLGVLADSEITDIKPKSNKKKRPSKPKSISELADLIVDELFADSDVPVDQCANTDCKSFYGVQLATCMNNCKNRLYVQ